MTKSELKDKIFELIKIDGSYPYIFSELNRESIPLEIRRKSHEIMDELVSELIDENKIQYSRSWNRRMVFPQETPNKYEKSYIFFEIVGKATQPAISKIFYGKESYDYIFSDEYNEILSIVHSNPKLTSLDYISGYTKSKCQLISAYMHKTNDIEFYISPDDNRRYIKLGKNQLRDRLLEKILE